MSLYFVPFELQALTVLEYLVAHGSERLIDEIRVHAYQISVIYDTLLCYLLWASVILFTMVMTGTLPDMPDSSRIPVYRFRWKRSGNQC